MTPPSAPLSEAEQLDWLRLSRSDGIGPRTFVGLLHRFGSAAAAIEALPKLAKARPGVRLASRDTAQREWDGLQAGGFRLLALNEPAYPAALRTIDSAPPLIAVSGDPAVLSRPMVALVGSRNASGAGLVFTERLAAGIGAGGYVVVSGLAYGVDARAHKAALATGTVAVMAGGLDRIYPEANRRLAASIAEAGAVITEMPLGWQPRGRDFPRRNRIVSGLALATVVVEAARRSGSLITARYAAEQGREVLAVPGSPLDPRAEGTNDLLRNGATLCTRVEDVLEAVEPMTERHPASERLLRSLREQPEDDELAFDPGWSDPDERARVTALLGPAPIPLDDLVRLSGVSAGRVRMLLLDLEVMGEASLQGTMVLGQNPQL